MSLEDKTKIPVLTISAGDWAAMYRRKLKNYVPVPVHFGRTFRNEWKMSTSVSEGFIGIIPSNAEVVVCYIDEIALRSIGRFVHPHDFVGVRYEHGVALVPRKT